MARKTPLLALAATVAAALLLSIPASAQPRVRSGRAAASYFPLADGNQWLYQRHATAGEETWKVTATAPSDSTSADRPYSTLAGYFFGLPREVRADRGDQVGERDPHGSRDLLWYLLAAPVGTTWELRLAEQPAMGPYSGCISGSVLTVASRGEMVAVPAGVFRGVVRVDFVPPCADAGIASEWFAPGVGLIRREEFSIAGPVVSELVQAKVGGRVFPFSAYETAVALERPILVNDLMPGVGPRPLPIVSGAFALRNPTDMPVELMFTGCRSTTVTVTDSEGRVVLTSHADDGGCCACDSLERLVLVRDSLVLPFSFTLATEKGEPLTDGWYSLEAILDTMDPPALRPAARARIEVQSVY